MVQQESKRWLIMVNIKSKEYDNYINKYMEYVREIKQRVDITSDFYLVDEVSIFNAEVCALQLRKILELIALSSLVANKTAYNTISKKLQKEWNAKKIIAELEKINPCFYPHPIKHDFEKKSPDTEEWVDESEYLTKADFINLYNVTSEILHTPNFKKKNFINKIENFWKNIDMYLNKIIRLTNRYQVQLLETVLLFVIIDENGGVTVHTAECLNFEDANEYFNEGNEKIAKKLYIENDTQNGTC